MNPTLFSVGPYRFFFFSREESRIHVHVLSSTGEAKFWLEPTVALASYHGLKPQELKKIQKIVEKEYEKIIKTWKSYFQV